MIRPRVIYHWRIDTTNFTFDAYGDSVGQCARVMREAWAKHRRATGATDTWAEVASNAPRAVTLGNAYRDGELFIVG